MDLEKFLIVIGISAERYNLILPFFFLFACDLILLYRSQWEFAVDFKRQKIIHKRAYWQMLFPFLSIMNWAKAGIWILLVLSQIESLVSFEIPGQKRLTLCHGRAEICTKLHWSLGGHKMIQVLILAKMNLIW